MAAEQLASLWAQAVSEVADRECLNGDQASAFASSTGAIWADAAARIERATADGAAAELDAMLCALTAKVAQQRTEVPEAVRTHFATQHDAHYAQIADAAERARAAERAPLPPPPPPDAAAAERLRALAARDSALARELREVSSDVHALAAAQSTLLSELDGVIALESRPCVTQQTIGGVKALAHTERSAQARALAAMQPQHFISA